MLLFPPREGGSVPSARAARMRRGRRFATACFKYTSSHTLSYSTAETDCSRFATSLPGLALCLKDETAAGCCLSLETHRGEAR